MNQPNEILNVDPIADSTLGSPTIPPASLASQGQATLAQCLEPVQEDLMALRSEIKTFIPTETSSAAQVVEQTFSSGGKYIRPALYFLSARLLGYEGPHLMPMAAVGEMIHCASLLHDDVVDSSTLRRNKPTARAVWGDQTSVLVGDLIYSRASEMMAETGNLDVVSIFAKAIRTMSEGELYQLEGAFSLSIPEKTYFRILECKTACLIAACCQVPALLAGRPEEERKALEVFGHSLGMAFQLVDDALDYSGLRALFGKAPLTDLKEGKCTWPLLLLRNQATDAEWSEVQRLMQVDLGKDLGIEKNGEMTREDDRRFSYIPELVKKYQTDQQTIEKAQSFTNKAIQSLKVFPKSQKRDHLESLAHALTSRVK